MIRCTNRGKESFEDGLISIIHMEAVDEKGHAKYENYCFDCRVEELKTRLKGVPITIEVPDYPEYTGEELIKQGAAINYTAELIDYPPHK